MNKEKARKIAETVKNHELLQMFESARLNVKNWADQSMMNKKVTRRAALIILAAGFDVHKNYHVVAKTHMIIEFGKYLPGYLLLPEEIK